MTETKGRGRRRYHLHGKLLAKGSKGTLMRGTCLHSLMGARHTDSMELAAGESDWRLAAAGVHAACRCTASAAAAWGLIVLIIGRVA
jgi:hypothetical protein